MPRFLGLVCPDWRVYFLANDSEEVRKDSLASLVDSLEIGWRVAGNLKNTAV